MTPKERYLYHQIHPLKLATDWICGIGSLPFFWQHDLAMGLIVLFAPPIVVSFLVMQFLPLDGLGKSALGRQVAKHMTPRMDALRLFGMLIMVLAAWYHAKLLILVGLVVILAVWVSVRRH